MKYLVQPFRSLCFDENFAKPLKTANKNCSNFQIRIKDSFQFSKMEPFAKRAYGAFRENS